MTKTTTTTISDDEIRALRAEAASAGNSLQDLFQVSREKVAKDVAKKYKQEFG